MDCKRAGKKKSNGKNLLEKFSQKVGGVSRQGRIKGMEYYQAEMSANTEQTKEKFDGNF